MARYTRRGRSKILFVPTIAVKAVPTRIELTAGTQLTPQIAEVSGFEFNNSPIATPDLETTYTTTIPGEDTAADSTLTFYDDDTTSTIRTALAKGTAGYIVLLPYGDVATKRCEVWPVASTGVADAWSAGNEAAMFKVGFGISLAPTQNAVVPAP